MTVFDLELGTDGVLIALTGYTWYPERTPFHVIMWNATSGEKLYTLAEELGPSFSLPQFSPDGRYLAVKSSDPRESGTGYIVLVYDLTDPKAAPRRVPGVSFAWSPSGDQILVGALGNLTAFHFPSMEVAHLWKINDYDGYIGGLRWLDGGKQISWEISHSQYLYDFETNTERAWTMRPTDRFYGLVNGPPMYVFKKMGYVVTVNEDATVRFWKEW